MGRVCSAVRALVFAMFSSFSSGVLEGYARCYISLVWCSIRYPCLLFVCMYCTTI